jgi:hypothetical protein
LGNSNLINEKTEQADFAIVALATTAESDTTNLHSSTVNFQFSPGSYSKNLIIPEAGMGFIALH